MINPTGPTGLVTGLSAVKLHLAIRMILVAVQTQPIRQVTTTGNTPATDLVNEFARKSTHKAAQAASSRYESGKPVIITDFSILATRQTFALARRTAMRWLEGLLFSASQKNKVVDSKLFTSFLCKFARQKGTKSSHASMNSCCLPDSRTRKRDGTRTFLGAGVLPVFIFNSIVFCTFKVAGRE
ncbi:MAG: hypothetical protein ABIX00_04205 [Polaromonas sp.]